MPRALRKTLDNASGSQIVSGSPTTTIDGFAAVRIGDLVADSSHFVTGSASVFVDGLPICRVGDLTSSSKIGAGGSPTVTAA